MTKFKLFTLSALFLGAQIAGAEEAPVAKLKSHLQRLTTKVAVLEERLDELTIAVANKGNAPGVNCQCAQPIYHGRNGTEYRLIPVSAETVEKADEKCKRYDAKVRDCKVVSPEKF